MCTPVAPRATTGPPGGETDPAPASPPAGGATPRPRVRARPRATRLGVREAVAEVGPGGRQKMARVCRRQQCSAERRGFRQELDSWRHKLIHCVGEILSRPPQAYGPPRSLPPRTWGGSRGRGNSCSGPPALFGSGFPPPPPPGEQCARPPGGLSWAGLSARTGPSPPRTLPGAGSRPESLSPQAFRLLSSGCGAPPPTYCGDSLGSTATGRVGAATGPAEPSAGPAVLDSRLVPSSDVGVPSLFRASLPPRAAPVPRARAASWRALGRVRGVRWRWGRREPELSQARGPPDRAKWGVMAAGGSGCTSSAGGGGGGGVNPQRSGRCVYLCLVCALPGGRGVGPGPTETSRSCRLPGDLPEPPPHREPSSPLASQTLGRPGLAFSPPRAGGSVDRGAPGGARQPSCASHTVCFVCFSLPRSRFPLCGGRRDHKGLTHIFNPPPKSKWPVWCLRSARRSLAPVHPCV